MMSLKGYCTDMFSFGHFSSSSVPHVWTMYWSCDRWDQISIAQSAGACCCTVVCGKVEEGVGRGVEVAVGSHGWIAVLLCLFPLLAVCVIHSYFSFYHIQKTLSGEGEGGRYLPEGSIREPAPDGKFIACIASVRSGGCCQYIHQWVGPQKCL